MEPAGRQPSLLLCAVALGVSLAVTCFFLSRRRRRSLRRVGEVSQIFLYPLKSCRGMSLEEAECRECGLRSGRLRDRHWLVVKEDNVHVTARQEPRMVLIRASCDRDCLTLNAPEMTELRIPLTLPRTNAVFTCKVFGNEVQGRDCGDEASDWLSSFLKGRQTYRIVCFEDEMKARNPKKEYPLYTENDQVAYPDLAPLMLLSEASVRNLNTRLEKKVTPRNFRPNIVISGCDAFSEDSWQEIQIGLQVILKRVMPCPRCILTTVDPDTGVIDMKEPLETLRSFRLCDTADKEVYKSSPLFGQFLKVLKTGTLRVGDPVYHITY